MSNPIDFKFLKISYLIDGFHKCVVLPKWYFNESNMVCLSPYIQLEIELNTLLLRRLEDENYDLKYRLQDSFLSFQG